MKIVAKKGRIYEEAIVAFVLAALLAIPSSAMVSAAELEPSAKAVAVEAAAENQEEETEETEENLVTETEVEETETEKAEVEETEAEETESEEAEQKDAESGKNVAAQKTSGTSINVTGSTPEGTEDANGFYITSAGVLTGYKGPATDIVIPDTVKEIGERAFLANTTITSVTMGTSVTAIDEYAFYGCISLARVTFDANLTTIGYQAFKGCALTEVTIPSKVTSLGYECFAENTSLTKFVVNTTRLTSAMRILSLDECPDGLETVVTLPAKMPNIPESMFSCAKSVKSISIPAYVTEINIYAFEGSGVKSVSFASTAKLIAIDAYAFYACTALESIVIPANVTTLGYNCFEGDTALNKVMINTTKLKSSVGSNIFHNCSSLKTVTLPANMTAIPDNLFSNANYLESIVIPETVTKIGQYAFKDCVKLNNVIIPNAVTEVDYQAFMGCSALSKLTLGSGLQTISYDAFADCALEGTLTIPSKVTLIKDSAFENNNGLTKIIIKTTKLSTDSVTGTVFSGCTGVETVVLPSKMTCIPNYLFAELTSITAITLPSNITEIGRYAFEGCTNLESITIPDTVTAIDYEAFYNCASLTNANISVNSSLQTVDDFAFGACSALESIFLPATVESIDSNAFENTTSLETFTLAAAKTTISSWSDIFSGTNPYLVIRGLKNSSLYDYYTKLKSDSDYSYVTWESIGSYTQCTVKFDSNGGSGWMYPDTQDVYFAKYTYNGKSYTSGSTLKACVYTASSSTKVFNCWNTKADGSGTKYADCQKLTKLPTGNNNNKTVTLYATWRTKYYYVAFNANSGTGSMDKQKCNYGKSYNLTANAFKRKGYTFNGWNTKADGSGKSYTNKQSITSLTSKDKGTVTLYAQWKKVKYTITYNLNSGKNSSKNPSYYYVTSSTITLSNPTRSAYTFVGWYSDSKYKTKVTTIAKGSTGNKTLYAKWKATPYTITYNLNGGTNNSANPATYTITTADITLKSASRSGYTFAGWYSDSKYKTKVTKIAKGSTGAKTLYAKWTANTYTINYNANGGTGSMTATAATYGKSVALTKNAFKYKGHTFQGWNTKADGSGTWYENQASVKNLTAKSKGSVTLYAIWDSYTIKFDANLEDVDAGTMSDMKCAYNKDYDLSPNTFYFDEDHTFRCWNTKADGSGTSYANTATIRNLTSQKGGVVTLYAQWDYVAD